MGIPLETIPDSMETFGGANLHAAPNAATNRSTLIALALLLASGVLFVYRR